MSAAPSWNDVASFVASYMRERGAGRIAVAKVTSFHGVLLEEVTQAYLASRGLPLAAHGEVLVMVDSVL